MTGVRSHLTALLRELHWLPVRHRITYRPTSWRRWSISRAVSWEISGNFPGKIVCNVRAPYSDDCNFRQCFYAIWYLEFPGIAEPKIPGGNSREFLKFWRELRGIYRSLVFFPIFIVDYDILLLNLTHCIMCTTHDGLTAF